MRDVASFNPVFLIMKRLALIEDDYEIRNAIRNVLAGSTKIEIDLETDSVEKTILYYRTRPTPNVILLDLNLSGISGIEGLPLLRRHLPNASIIIHTIIDDDDKVFQAICHGASGYLLKTTPYEQLESHLLVATEEGGSPVSPSIARRILNYFNNNRLYLSSSKPEKLIDTERAIVNLLIDALTYQEIAEKLGMSINGVRYYIKRIYGKLQIKSRGQLVRHFLDDPNAFS